MMKVLNLYAGIGSNRKLWTDVEVTAIENNTKIAIIYQDFFPDDIVISDDAHQYLLEHYKEFDFIWSSPPCTTHSDFRRCCVHRGQNPAVYPDMNLYQEIILLKYFAPIESKWVVENVRGYYDPLIRPKEVSRHYFWSNFVINNQKINNTRVHGEITHKSIVYGFDILKYDMEAYDKRKILRNLFCPELGQHILDLAFKNKQLTII